MSRRFGWKEEILPPELDRLSERLALRRASLPAEVSLVRDLDVPILDQGGTSSCVAHAIAAAIRIRMALAHGVTRLESLPLPSRRWIYRLARETHAEGDVDDGTFISSGAFVCRDQGWPSEAHAPWSEERINEPMGDTARMHAHDQRDAVEEYAILGTGDSLEAELRAALATGYPVVCGATVPQSWCDLGYDWMPQTWGPDVAGGHAMVLVGYDADGYHLLNSWASTWGVGGLGRVTHETLRARIRSCHVVTVAERPTT